MATRNPITGDFIKSKKTNRKYRDGWDAIFSNKKDEKSEKRAEDS